MKHRLMSIVLSLFLASAAQAAPPSVWVCGNPGQVPSATDLANAGLGVVGVAPFMGWHALAAIGLPNQPWPLTAPTQTQVSAMCKAIVPSGFTGPVMWDNEGPMYKGMLLGENYRDWLATEAGDVAKAEGKAWLATIGSKQPQQAGEQWFETTFDRAHTSRSLATHCLYLNVSHTYPPQDYVDSMAGGEDRRAMNVWRLARITELFDEPGTGVMMSVYAPGWNTDWPDDKNYAEFARFSHDCVSAALQIGRSTNCPVYAVVSGRMHAENEKLTRAQFMAMMSGVLSARSLDGKRSVDGVIVWTAEENWLKRDNPTWSSTQVTAAARTWQLQEARWAAEACGLIAPAPPATQPAPTPLPPATQPQPQPQPQPPPPSSPSARAPASGPIDVGSDNNLPRASVTVANKDISGDVGVRVDNAHRVATIELTNVGVVSANYAFYCSDASAALIDDSDLRSTTGGDNYVVRGLFERYVSSDTTYTNNGGDSKAVWRLPRCGGGSSTRDTYTGARMMLGGGAANERDSPNEFKDFTFTDCRISVASIEFYPRTHHVSFVRCDFTGTGHFTFWEDAVFGDANNITFENCTIGGLPLNQGGLGKVNRAAERAIVAK